MSIAVEELEEKIKECFDLRDQVIALKEQLADITGDLERKQQYVADVLKSLNKDSYHSRHGIFGHKEKHSYKIARDPELKNLFFEFLKKEGVYDQLRTVHSASLNSYANEKIEKEGLMDYDIPGLEKSETYTVVSMRKQ
jgi:hypothetical protein